MPLRATTRSSSGATPEPASRAAVPMISMTFTVLDPFVFGGVATIISSGYPGDEFTITGTGCAEGLFDVGMGDSPGFLAFEDFIVENHNARSGHDPMWFRLPLPESAAPGMTSGFRPAPSDRKRTTTSR